jgi:hypothetical protein
VPTCELAYIVYQLRYEALVLYRNHMETLLYCSALFLFLVPFGKSVRLSPADFSLAQRPFVLIRVT